MTAVPKLFQNPISVCSQGLLRARSRFPEIVENIGKAKQRRESKGTGERGCKADALPIELTALSSNIYGCYWKPPGRQRNLVSLPRTRAEISAIVSCFLL